MLRPVKKPLDPMQRVIPKNPKYATAKPVVDSGATITKVEQITTREFLRRRDEQYGRVKASQLCGLIIEYSEGLPPVSEEGEESEREPALPVKRPTTLSGEPCEFVATAGEKPYLIVDVREPEEFEACHITEAINMPARVLSRDSIAPEIYRYKNRKEAMIILYDGGEAISSAVAIKMFERGCDNVFVVTGGLKSVGNKFPELLDGDLPADLKEKAPKVGGPRVPGSASSVVPSSARSVASSRAPSGGGAGGSWK